MSWLYDRSYVGPDRRSERQMRLFERRKQNADGSRASIGESLKRLAERGLRWVDHINYFGPDRRGGDFSYYFLERRRHESAGTPPPLHAALRQLRVRVLEVDDADARAGLRDRCIATAILAEAQARPDIGEILQGLAAKLDTADDLEDLASLVQAELVRAGAMLDDAAAV